MGVLVSLSTVTILVNTKLIYIRLDTPLEHCKTSIFLFKLSLNFHHHFQTLPKYETNTHKHRGSGLLRGILSFWLLYCAPYPYFKIRT
jgi:hypothetical protein